MEKEIEIKINSETTLGCLINNIIFIILLCSAFWFNYTFIDGNNILDVLIVFFVFVLAHSIVKDREKSNNYKGVSKEKIKKIKEILDKEYSKQ